MGTFQMMMEFLKEFIKPELMVLIPVLYFIGLVIKQSKVQSAWIPFVLGGVSIALSLLYLIGNCRVNCWQDGAALLFTGITQGILAAGASVYVNQMFKQKLELSAKEIKGKIDFI